MHPGDVIGGKYRLTRFLGGGAMGEVWAALNERTERFFALKLIAPNLAVDELRQQLSKEARASGRIHHRNVIEVYDVGETDSGQPFLVMELLEGETLAALLQRQGAMPAEQVAAILADVCRGLSAAHTAGVVHRDLKPANVFLHREADGSFTVKLLDFGVSKIASTEATATLTGMAIGTPAYMSPEQAQGSRDLDARSDLWALGVIAFEMLSGQRPFLGDSPYEVAAAVLSGPIPLLGDRCPSAPSALKTLVARCLQRDRSLRISSSVEALALLEGTGLVPRPSHSGSLVLAGTFPPTSSSDRLPALTKSPISSQPSQPSFHSSPAFTSAADVVVPSARQAFNDPATTPPIIQTPEPPPPSSPPRTRWGLLFLVAILASLATTLWLSPASLAALTDAAGLTTSTPSASSPAPQTTVPATATTTAATPAALSTTPPPGTSAAPASSSAPAQTSARPASTDAPPGTATASASSPPVTSTASSPPTASASSPPASSGPPAATTAPAATTTAPAATTAPTSKQPPPAKTHPPPPPPRACRPGCVRRGAHCFGIKSGKQCRD